MAVLFSSSIAANLIRKKKKSVKKKQKPIAAIKKNVIKLITKK